MLDADSANDVYPQPTVIRTGFEQLDALLRAELTQEVRLPTDYLLGINRVVKQLLSMPALQQAIAEQISAIKRASPDASLDSLATPSAELVRQLAEIYQSTISELPYRIHIHGLERHLKQPDIQHQIRALLLASTRAIVLWRQLGGTVFQLIWHRRHYRAAIAEPLSDPYR